MIIYGHPCNPPMQRNTTRLHTNFFRLFFFRQLMRSGKIAINQLFQSHQSSVSSKFLRILLSLYQKWTASKLLMPWQDVHNLTNPQPLVSFSNPPSQGSPGLLPWSQSVRTRAVPLKTTWKGHDLSREKMMKKKQTCLGFSWGFMIPWQNWF